jgi:hypothetical protein
LLFCLCFIVGQPLFGAELSLTETDDAIRVSQGGKPVLTYNKAVRHPPDGIAAYYRRSGYIHPVYSPTGQEVTGDFAPDHAHQHAVFMAWTKSTFDGKKIDFWNQKKQQAGVEFREVVKLVRETKQVSFSVKHAYFVGKGETKTDALYEIWTVTVHQTSDDHFLFDVESVQECASEKPLNLEKYHYGGMAFRGNTQWVKPKDSKDIKPGDVQYLTSDGKDRWEGNHTRPNWVAFSGKVDGEDVSAAVFCNPKNFRFPQPVRIHPNMPYFCFAPMVDGKFQITPKKKYVSRYRYLVTSSAADADEIEMHWAAYKRAADE